MIATAFLAASIMRACRLLHPHGRPFLLSSGCNRTRSGVLFSLPCDTLKLNRCCRGGTITIRRTAYRKGEHVSEIRPQYLPFLYHLSSFCVVCQMASTRMEKRILCSSLACDLSTSRSQGERCIKAAVQSRMFADISFAKESDIERR